MGVIRFSPPPLRPYTPLARGGDDFLGVPIGDLIKKSRAEKTQDFFVSRLFVFYYFFTSQRISLKFHDTWV